MFIYHLFISILSIFIFSNFAFCKELPIRIRQNGDTITVINDGDCIIYKLHVSSIPPEKEGIENYISRILAEIFGITSFTADLGKVGVGETLDFDKSSLTASDGKKLTGDYEIGSLKFEGSSCGDCGLSVVLKAD